jgi:Tol biopolymer transport system component/DNA-binding winged helix-turn-helix (wHTH) protein
MAVPSRHTAPFQLGAWCVDPATGQLTRGSEVRRARALVAQLLLYFAARPGEVVTKDDLVAGPWGGAAIADSALTSTIAELRELLDDQPKAPRYIETLPKRGYRLIAPVGAIEPPPGESVASPSPIATQVSRHHSWWSRRSWHVAFVIGAAFAIAIIVSIASRFRPADPPPPVHAMRFTIDLPPGVRLAPDTVPRLALSHDGSRMAYVIRADDGDAIYTRQLDQFASSRVAGTVEAIAPFFSPDGARIGYFAHGELRTVSISGGQSTIVCPARVALGASWTSDGVIVFSGTHGQPLFEVPASGGTPRPLTELDASRRELSHRWPHVTPDGTHVLFTAIRPNQRGDVLVMSRQSGERHVVVENAQTAMFVAPDRLVFEREGRLMTAPVDPVRWELTGSARVIVEAVTPSGPGLGNPLFAIADNGALVYVPNDPHDVERDLVWVDRAGAVTSTGAPARSYMDPRLSPDDRQVITWFRQADPDLWLVDLASRTLTRLATGIPGRRHSLSPDGLRVMFDAPSDDNPVSIYEADVRGGSARRLRSDRNSQYAGAWAPDGAIAYVNLSRTTGFDIVRMGNELDAAATPVLASAANETAPAFSPDGRWLAYVSDVTGHEEVYLMAWPQGGAPLRVSTQGGREPVWSKRGDELFFRRGQSMLAARVAGGAQLRVSEPVTLFTGEFDERPSFLANYDVASDGRFLMIRSAVPSAAPARIAVVLRWDVP